MVQVYDATQQKMYLYLDGQLISPAMDVTKTLASNNDYYVGAWVSSYGWVPGTFDEFRISDLARSPAWIRANWLLLSDPEMYLLFGAQQFYVPEPATGSLALLALVGLASFIWRKNLLRVAGNDPSSLC